MQVKIVNYKFNFIWYLNFTASTSVESSLRDIQRENSTWEKFLFASKTDFAITSYDMYKMKKKWKHSLFIGLVGWVFANGPGHLGSIAGRVILETLKMVLDTSLVNTQQYKVRIESKVDQSRERNSILLYTSV